MKMKLNKEEFLRTDFGRDLRDCIALWDRAIDDSNIHSCWTEEYEMDYSIIRTCGERWKVYKEAIKHFYGIEYCLSRTDEYFGLVTEDEKDWLFKEEKKKRE